MTYTTEGYWINALHILIAVLVGFLFGRAYQYLWGAEGDALENAIARTRAIRRRL